MRDNEKFSDVRFEINHSYEQSWARTFVLVSSMIVIFIRKKCHKQLELLKFISIFFQLSHSVPFNSIFFSLNSQNSDVWSNFWTSCVHSQLWLPISRFAWENVVRFEFIDDVFWKLTIQIVYVMHTRTNSIHRKQFRSGHYFREKERKMAKICKSSYKWFSDCCSRLSVWTEKKLEFMHLCHAKLSWLTFWWAEMMVLLWVATSSLN